MADGTFTTNGNGIAGKAKAKGRLTDAERDALCDQAVAAQAAALAAMTAAEKHALCDQAVARAWKVAGRHRDFDAAAEARAELPGLVWAALTDLTWARERAKRRIRADHPASIDLDARTLARIAINCLDSQDDRRARQGRNANGIWNGVETEAGCGDDDDEPGCVIVDHDTPELEAEADEALAAAELALPFLLHEPAALPAAPAVLRLVPVALHALAVPPCWPADRPFQGELLSIPGTRLPRAKSPRRPRMPAPFVQLDLDLPLCAAGGAS